MSKLIRLDGNMESTLDWRKAESEAASVIEQGEQVLWEIELGLFNQLRFPLSDQAQFLSLTLALEHFRDTLWREFSEHSQGVVLYRGTADFRLEFRWDGEQVFHLQEWLQEVFIDTEKFEKETGLSIEGFTNIKLEDLKKSQHSAWILALFCRDVASSYLNRLAEYLPDTLPCFVSLDTQNIHDPILANLLVHRERYFPLQILEEERANSMTLGVCFPSADVRLPSHYASLREGLAFLQRQKISFRIILENMLTQEWDGLNELMAIGEGISLQTKRKLLGFCAAGGLVISLEKMIGVPHEISFEEWSHARLLDKI